MPAVAARVFGVASPRLCYPDPRTRKRMGWAVPGAMSGVRGEVA
jgi:hypothetical protein